MKRLICAILVFGLTIMCASSEHKGKRRRKHKPLGRPSRIDVIDTQEGFVEKDGHQSRRRRSRLNVDDLLLEDDKDVEIQLMLDETFMKFKLKKQDFDDDPFTSYSSTEDSMNGRITFVTSTTRDGQPVMVGTAHNANGTIYQIRQLADQELIVEEVQDGFDPEFEGPLREIQSDQGRDGSTADIDFVDGVVTDQSDGRYLRAGGERRLVDDGTVLDVMVSICNLHPYFDIEPHSHSHLHC